MITPVLLLAFLTLLVNAKNPSVAGYDRIIVNVKDVSLTTNTIDRLLDKGFVRALTFGGNETLYNATYLDMRPTSPGGFLLTTDAYYQEQYGIHILRDGVYSTATGGYNFPYGSLYPVTNGDDFLYRHLIDSKYPHKQLKNTWICVGVSLLFISNTTTTMPGGIMGGTELRPRDLLTYTHHNFLDTEQVSRWNILDPRWREISILKFTQPGIQNTNSQGRTEQFEKGTATEEDGTQGWYTIMVTSTIMPDGEVRQSTRTVITVGWNVTYPEPIF